MGNSLGLIVDKKTVADTPWGQDVNNAVFYGLGLNNYNNRDSFALGLNYAVNDYVVYPGYSTQVSVLYVCIATVTVATLTPDADPAHWALFVAEAQLATPTGAGLVGFQQPESNTFPTTLLLLGQEQISAYAFMSKTKAAAVRARTAVDVTTELNNALAAVCAEGRQLDMPYGLYQISGPLVVPAAQGWQIAGKGRYGTSIVQNANNTPIFKFTGVDTHSWRISDMYGYYATQQNSSQTNAKMFSFEVTGNGTYQFAIDGITFDYGYAMLGNDETTRSIWYNCSIGCLTPVWSLPHVVGSFAIANPNVANGQPRYLFGNVYVRADVMTRAPLILTATDSVAIGTFEVNNLGDVSLMTVGGGASIAIQAIRSESEVRTAASNNTNWLDTSDSTVRIELLLQSINTLNLGATGRMKLTSIGGAAGNISVGAMTLVCNTNTSGTVLVSTSTSKVARLTVDHFPLPLAAPFWFSDIDTTSGADFATVNDWSNGHISFNHGDANYSMTIGDETTQFFNTALTADRVLKLPPINATSGGGAIAVANVTGGYRVEVRRGANASGAFNLIIEDSAGTPLGVCAAASTSFTVQFLRASGWVAV